MSQVKKRTVRKTKAKAAMTERLAGTKDSQRDQVVVDPDDYHNDVYQPDAFSIFFCLVRMQLLPVPFLLSKCRSKWTKPEPSPRSAEMSSNQALPQSTTPTMWEAVPGKLEEGALISQICLKLSVIAWLLAGSDRMQVSLAEVFLPMWLQFCFDVGLVSEEVVQSADSEEELCDKLFDRLGPHFLELFGVNFSNASDWRELWLPELGRLLRLEVCGFPILKFHTDTLEDVLGLIRRPGPHWVWRINLFMYRKDPNLCRLSQFLDQLNFFRFAAHESFVRRFCRVADLQSTLAMERPAQLPAHFSSFFHEYKQSVANGQVELSVLAEQLLLWPRHPNLIILVLIVLLDVAWACLAVALFCIVLLAPDFLRDRRINFDLVQSGFCALAHVLPREIPSSVCDKASAAVKIVFTEHPHM